MRIFVIHQSEKGILVIFLEDTHHRLIFHQVGKLILFQTKDFAKNIKETTLAKYFIKITARPSFRQLRVMRQINRVYYISK